MQHEAASDEFRNRDNNEPDIELQFDKNGNFKGAIDDGKKEYSGSIVDDNGSVVKRFNFNDQEDAKKIIRKENMFIDMNFSNMTAFYLSQSGVKGAKNLFLRYQYAAINSPGGGSMDFLQHLYKHSGTDKVLYLAGNTTYNNYDAGNFFWGLAMKKLGFDYGSTKVGSEVNGFFNSKRQNGDGYGVTLHGDSVEDQKAIRNGYFWNK